MKTGKPRYLDFFELSQEVTSTQWLSAFWLCRISRKKSKMKVYDSAFLNCLYAGASGDWGPLCIGTALILVGDFGIGTYSGTTYFANSPHSFSLVSGVVYEYHLVATGYIHTDYVVGEPNDILCITEDGGVHLYEYISTGYATHHIGGDAYKLIILDPIQSVAPTFAPSIVPSAVPTPNPTSIPTILPSLVPTRGPSLLPTSNPTYLLGENLPNGLQVFQVVVIVLLVNLTFVLFSVVLYAIYTRFTQVENCSSRQNSRIVVRH